MIKKTITYTDFNGDQITEDFYFNLTKTECAKMEIESNGLSEKINAIIKTGDNAELYRIFEDIVLSSYGEKSDDGKRFMKTPEIRNNFKCSAAYDVLMMEFFTDASATKVSDFINGVIPKLD